MLQTHVNNDIYNKYCLIHNTGISKSANFRFLPRLSAIFGFRRDRPRDCASCREPRQEAELRGQIRQDAVFACTTMSAEAKCEPWRRSLNNWIE